jgi:tellurite resistance protein TerC
LIWAWTGFIGLVILLLVMDLGIFHKKAHAISIREALKWSAFWIALSLVFSIIVYFGYENHWFGLGTSVDAIDGTINDGHAALLKYLSGYVVEKSLSMDNIFVIAVIFGFFGIPAVYQHRVLFWGILGALILRGIMIVVGIGLIVRFHWILYVFGVFLILTAIKMLTMGDEETDPSKNPILKLIRKRFPVTSHFHGEHFLVRAGSKASLQAEIEGAPVKKDDAVLHVKPGTLMLTPLALTLVVVETSDVIFAVDSIPAIFAITTDPFLVFTSNIFAILGLRSLYFALAGMVRKFRYLKHALALILLIVGVKMLALKWIKAVLGEHFNIYLLIVILFVLLAGAMASLFADSKKRKTGKKS